MSYRDINLDENILSKNKIPLLIYSKEWIDLFNKLDNKTLNNLKKELEDQIKEKNQLEREENKLKNDKTKAMKMILKVSNSVNNENKTQDVKLLDEYKEEMENINERMDNITFEIDKAYDEIKGGNFELLKATIYYGYKELKKREKKLISATEELESIRSKTRDLINEKYDHEEWIQTTYSFLHGILGWEEIEKLDEKILE